MTIAQVLARAAKRVERTGPPLCRVRKGVPCFPCSVGDGPVEVRVFLQRFAPSLWGRWADHDLNGAEAATWLSSAAEWAKVLGK